MPSADTASPPQKPSLTKAASGVARSVGMIALSIVLVPALAVYVIIGTGSATFFRARL